MTEMCKWSVTDEFTIDMLNANEIAIYAGSSTEERGRISKWDNAAESRGGGCVSITSPAPESLSDLLLANFESGDSHKSVSLRADSQIMSALGEGDLFIDVSGLPHHIWASVLRAGIAKNLRIRVMYIEPREYRYHKSPSSNSMFDLSTGKLGLCPLPGFATLSEDPWSNQRVFVPLLGFEGNRALYLSQRLDPAPPHTIPIVGVPGFRLEYPSVAVACNLDFLDQTDAYSQVRTVAANDVFGVMDLFEDLEKEFSSEQLLIAPVGTKPHAVGAVLHAIRRRGKVELMYDNPIKRPERTSGVGKVHIYTVN
ncbi:hypothetical protein [Enhygromyxa salina]|uniref:Uncharacterized protein n=1 Tax=Enhygromyxa salina TaxID=215803 RepID=A0A2S9YLN9_9BACT|nr:hypothetical protein [Enhygromyxa salina]PRQ06007.1 hypothetical protein ENSA7_42690 [Enhygromyxa salina]